MGIDWDKYGAGTNIVVLEVCSNNYEEDQFKDKIKICHREEIQKSEYTLTRAVERIIELNAMLNPKHIYVDRGFGEVQVELLHKHGVENPHTRLREKVKGLSFAETIDVRDPYTKLMIKKELKPYMVDNLRQYLERGQLCIPSTDDEMYMQLISYVVIRTTQTGRPVFEASGSAVDHAHDALLLALLAVAENYGEFSKTRAATNIETVSNSFFIPQQQFINSGNDSGEKNPTSRVDKLKYDKMKVRI